MDEKTFFEYDGVKVTNAREPLKTLVFSAPTD